MKSALLMLVCFAATISSMTLKERITWQEKDPKGEYSHIMAKHYIKSHFVTSISLIRKIIKIQLEISETTIYVAHAKRHHQHTNPGTISWL